MVATYETYNPKNIYQGDLYTPREVVGSQAFNLEYRRDVSDQELYDDIVSYLGEYRLQVPRYSYDLVYAPGDNSQGEYNIRDVHRGEAMVTKARRAILERTHRKEPIHREIAEEAGLRALEAQLKHAKTGDTIVWISPPGPKEQGYGDYSFLNKGDVVKTDDGILSLSMQAIRLEDATLAEEREFMFQILGEDVDYKTPEDFIAHPHVLPFTIPDQTLDRYLKDHFRFHGTDEDQRVFGEIISRMEPLIQEFITLTKYGSREEKLRAFYALENFALQLDKETSVVGEICVFHSPYGKENEFVSLAALSVSHGYEPPKVSGSCGSSNGSSAGSNVMSFGSSMIDSLLSGDSLQSESVESGCKCVNKDDNHYHCPGCDKKYADETNTSPENRTAKCSCGFEFGCGAGKKSSDEQRQPVDFFWYAKNKEKRDQERDVAA